MRGRVQGVDRQSPGDHAVRRGGFTLIELLIVITIILLVSAVALPTVLPALSHRQVSEAGRILQGALVGARDKAIHDGQPSGIRLLPDPAYYSLNSTTGAVDPTQPLAFGRIVPIGPAPDYQEGYCTAIPPAAYGGTNLPYTYALSAGVSFAWSAAPAYPNALMVCQSARTPGTGAPNPPTSWYWNIRVGDKVQINGAGTWYSVIGPVSVATPEQFVNVGPAAPITGTSPVPQLTTAVGSGSITDAVEYLFLVNMQDDNANGWPDEGFDGVDNDGDGLVDETSCKISSVGEWEAEAWTGSMAASPAVNVPYTISRRPVPNTDAREIALPTSMVIDATTWAGSRERSRLPVNPYSGTVDLMVNPDGTVAYSGPYGVPTSYGFGDVFYHFWLAERQDVAIPSTAATAAPFLPIARPGGNAGLGSPPYLRGEYSILTVNARTGATTVSTAPPFFYDPAIGYTNRPTAAATYNPTYPFIQAEQGISSTP